MKDRFGRNIEYMRISVTDRCDLRCRYCMPEEGIKKVDKSEILSYEQILRVCEAAILNGINKFKITGGEPLVRYDLVKLVKGIKSLDGTEQVTITTNGQRLKDYLDDLIDAGIDGINISLDTLRPERYEYITRVGKLEKTLEAIDLCLEKGVNTKLNCLIQKDFNEDETVDIANYAMDKGIAVRFIEMMPIGFADAMRGVSNEETLEILKKAYPDLTEDTEKHGNGPAVYYKVPSRNGTIGIISSVHGKFCESCNRIRLTSMGMLKPCLCYDSGRDLKPFLEAPIEGLRAIMHDAVTEKPKSHCFEKAVNGSSDMTDKHAMAEIGG
jgi:cyclic pyranopterin phosphate synthase